MTEDQQITLPPLEERPLVTFALFAYNQEKYIREAVEGAFEQTYEPLEIILSDDCSTDRTFAIMREIAAGYRGQHRLILRQNKRNLGLISHVNTVIEVATSEIIVFAAGDDISVADRVDRIVSCFRQTANIMLVHSQVILMDEKGQEIGLREPPIIDINPDPGRLALAGSIYIGATGAIRKKIYDDFGPISESETYEDLTFAFRASLIGSLSYLKSPLVKYRSNIGISSQFRQMEGLRKSRRISHIRHQIATLEQRSKDLLCIKHRNQNEITRNIEHQKKINQARLCFYTAPLMLSKDLSLNGLYCAIRAIYSESRFILQMPD